MKSLVPAAVPLVGTGAAAAEKAADWIEMAVFRPRFYPPISAVVISADGKIWIRREELQTSEVCWEVIDLDGRRLGHFFLPTRVQVLAAERTAVWGVEHDELDVPSIVKFEVHVPRQ